MQNSRKSGDNTLADALSHRLAMFGAFRSVDAAFDFEPKPTARLGASAATLRSSHSVRSVAVHPGTMSWHELHSPLHEESAAFLATLLGGDVVTTEHGGLGTYSTVLSDGLQVAGALQTEHGKPAHWNTFVRVPNVDLLCEIALSLGGSVRVEPSGIIGLDRRGIISDPTGASLTIIAGGDDRRTVGAGALGWDELRSIDPMESVRFWCSLFEWTASPIITARDAQGVMLLNGGRPVASVQMAMPTEARSRWLPVATVRRDQFDSAVYQAIRAGARISVAPSPHGILDRCGIFVDPAGAEFAIGAEPVVAIAAA